MNIKDSLKAKIPKHLKRRLNVIRYTSLPYFKMRLNRALHKPHLPKNPDGKILIHLGCGDQNDSRFINIDVIPFTHVHFVHDVTRLPMFQNNVADLIYGSHVLEHVSYKYSLEAVQEWFRVLKPGGVLRISLPDFDKILKIYEAENHSIPMIEGPLMGGQNYPYNFHYGVFNKTFLSDLFKKAGFSEVREWDPKTAQYHTFDDWAGRLLYSKYPLSLNLEAIKS